MHRLPSVFFWLLFCVQCEVSAGPIDAKVRVQSKVYSVAEDGSVQLLRPSPSFVLDLSTLKNLSARILTPDASLAATPITGTNDIVAGDVLRYEITVSNETDFLVPALALDILEQIAPSVALTGYAQGHNNRWRVERLPNLQSLNSDSLRSATNPLASMETGSSGQRLRLRNLEPLGVGGQLVFAYDVTVLESQGRDSKTP